MTKPDALNTYEQIAAAYAEKSDRSPYNAYYDRPAMLGLIGPMAGLRVIDLGCGHGSYVEAALQQGATHVVGIDGSSQMCQIARERTGGRAEILCADLARPLDMLAPASFDLVISALALHHLADWGHVMGEIHRILCPGGRLVFSIGHPIPDLAASPSGAYFEIELIREEWPSYGIEMPSYRRSLTATVDPVLDAGLVIERILEPRPVPALKDIDPEAFAVLDRSPNFFCIRARKP